ncbi:hypothetical protein JXB28_06445 [Candidatus Woesearchaeota archaeon]|nr:hypothetical protein [Candidatus Woesearchaeota archaeon]
MRKALVLVVAMLIIATLLGGTALTSADENYNGEDGEQPGIGVIGDYGDGVTGDVDTGVRLRFKEV